MDIEKPELKEHMAKVTKAIHKINREETLDDSDIREILKSLMNAQIMISEIEEDHKNEIKTSIEKLEKQIKKLEDFMFRDSNKV